MHEVSEVRSTASSHPNSPNFVTPPRSKRPLYLRLSSFPHPASSSFPSLIAATILCQHRSEEIVIAVAPHNKERQESLQRKREEMEAEETQKKAKTFDWKGNRKVEDEEQKALAPAETREMSVKASKKRKAVEEVEETRKKAKTLKAARIDQKRKNERRILAKVKKWQMPVKASEETNTAGREEEARKKEAAMREQRWASRSAMVSQKGNQPGTRTRRQKLVPVIPMTQQESSAQQTQLQESAHQKPQDDGATLVTSQNPGRDLNDTASRVASVNLSNENAFSEGQGTEGRDGAVAAKISRVRESDKSQVAGHHDADSGLSPIELGSSERADHANVKSKGYELINTAADAASVKAQGVERTQDADDRAIEVGEETARGDGLNKGSEAEHREGTARAPASKDMNPDSSRDNDISAAANSVATDKDKTRALAFLETLASNAATHRLLRHVTERAREWDKFMVDLLNYPEGLKKLEQVISYKDHHGMEIEEGLRQAHADLVTRYRTAEASYNEMAATRKAQSSRQLQKNARIYEFTDVAADSPELRCLPPVFWEIFTRCQDANIKAKVQQARLEKNDREQIKCSRKIEEFISMGARNALMASVSDSADQPTEAITGDPMVLGNHLRVLATLSSQQIEIEVAIEKAKDEQRQAELTLNEIATRALVAAKVLCSDVHGDGKRKHAENEDITGSRQRSENRRQGRGDRESHDGQAQSEYSFQRTGEHSDEALEGRQQVEARRALADEVVRARAVLYECEVNLENARSEPISAVDSTDQGARRVARLTRRTGEFIVAEGQYLWTLHEAQNKGAIRDPERASNFGDDGSNRDPYGIDRFKLAKRVLPSPKNDRVAKWVGCVPHESEPYDPSPPPGSADSSFYVASLEFGEDPFDISEGRQREKIKQESRLREHLRKKGWFEEAENDFHPKNREYNQAVSDGSFFQSHPDKPEAACWTEPQSSDQQDRRDNGFAQGGQDKDDEQSQLRDQPAPNSIEPDSQAKDAAQTGDEGQARLDRSVIYARRKRRAWGASLEAARHEYAGGEIPATANRTRKRARDESLERQICPMPAPKRVRLTKSNENIADDSEPAIEAPPISARTVNGQFASRTDEQNEQREALHGIGKILQSKKDPEHTNAEYLRASSSRSSLQSFAATTDRMEIDDGDGLRSQSGTQRTPNNVATAAANDWIGDEWDSDIDGIE